MRLLRQALFCLTIILGAAACAAPANGPQIKKPHSVNDHISPPKFKDSTTTTSNQGYCGSLPSPAPRSTGCFSIYAPVCGCDGKTYSNACTANSKGVSVSSKGECAP